MTPLRAQDQVFWDYWFLDDGILRIRILSRYQIWGSTLLFFPALWLDILFVEVVSGVYLSGAGVVGFVIVLLVLPFAPTAALLLGYPYVKRQRVLNKSREELLRSPNQLIKWAEVVGVDIKRRRVTIQLKSGETFRARLRSDESSVRSFVQAKMVEEPSRPAAAETLQLQPYIIGMGGYYSLYVISEDGLTSTPGRRRSLYAMLIPSIVAAYILAMVTHIASWLVLFMLVYLLIIPVYDEVAFRNLRKLVQIPPSELLARSTPSTRISWNEISSANYSGNALRIKLPAKNPRGAYVVLERDSSQKTTEFLKGKLGDRLAAKHRGRLAIWFARLPSAPLILFVLGTVLFVAASVYPFFRGEQSHYATVLASLRSQLAAASPVEEFALIFLNNVQVALADAVPGLGSIVFFLSEYNTGRVLQVIAIQANTSPYLLLRALYVLPHTWLEELSYAIAGGLIIQYTLRAIYLDGNPPFSEQLGNRRSRPSVQLSIGFAEVAGMLVVAAALETIEPYVGVGAYFLWLPVLGFAAWYLWRYVKRVRSGKTSVVEVNPETA